MPAIKRAFAKLFFIAAAGLLLIPGVSYWFTGYAEGGLTQDFRAALDVSIDRDSKMSPRQRLEAKTTVESITLAGLCRGTFPQFERLRTDTCAPGSEVWQFHAVRAVSLCATLLGISTLLAIVALALIGYFVPRLQVKVFTAGWWGLRAISGLEIVVQGALLVWLSFWLTAYFTHHYLPKLVLIAGLMAAAGVFAAVSAIFRRVPEDNTISGELIGETQAPHLWTRVKQLCVSLNTAPPENLIGGIDDNFFVTQAPLRVQERLITGRTLFVSLPLLRAIERHEADAVLAHEMAHFSGGDTEEGARLGPQLNAYAHYMQALGHNALTMLAFYVMNLFRVAFELARSRESRIREFAADRKAASLTSPSAISRALIRIAAYAEYRRTVEQELFAQSQQYEGSLQVAQRVAQGLAAFTQTENFKTTLATGAVPHPFDSHPPLQQRMEHVGAVIEPHDFAAVVAATPAQTWVDLIPDADAIERRLWERYESQFASEHLRALSVRYEPANDAEKEVVLRFFPDVVFALKKQRVLRVTYAGIEAPEQAVAWKEISNIQYKDGSFSTRDVLTLTHFAENGRGKGEQTKMKIALQHAERARLKNVLGHYWGRDQIMRRLQREAKESAPAPESP